MTWNSAREAFGYAREVLESFPNGGPDNMRAAFDALKEKLSRLDLT